MIPTNLPTSAPAKADTGIEAATETDIFFAQNKSDLTPDDRASLDSYATRYLAAKSTETVEVEGWASTEGLLKDNNSLSERRAKTVADYLVSKGIPTDKVKPKGSGPTPKFSSSKLPPNRRVTLKPPPPAAPKTSAPPPPASKPIDIDPNSPQNKKLIEEYTARLREAEDWVRDHLKKNGLRPDPVAEKGETVLYTNKSTKMDDVVTETVKEGAKAPIKDPTLITEEMVRRIAPDVLIEAMPGGKAMSPASVQVQLTYMFIPTTHHTPLGGGKSSNDKPAQQLEFDIVVALHAEGKSGVEFTGKANATCFADSGSKTIKVQNASGGLQVAWVESLLNNNIQISPQLAVTFGGSRAELDGKENNIQWTPTGQVSASGQALFTVPGRLKGILWIGIQAGVAVNAPARGTATLDSSGGLVIVFQIPHS